MDVSPFPRGPTRFRIKSPSFQQPTTLTQCILGARSSYTPIWGLIFPFSIFAIRFGLGPTAQRLTRHSLTRVRGAARHRVDCAAAAAFPPAEGAAQGSPRPPRGAGGGGCAWACGHREGSRRKTTHHHQVTHAVCLTQRGRGTFSGALEIITMPVSSSSFIAVPVPSYSL